MTVMEVNRTQPTTKQATVKGRQITFDFVGDLKAEISKINWTSRDELQVYTKIVVAATFLCGIGVYGMDLMIQGVLNGLETIIHLIGG